MNSQEPVSAARDLHELARIHRGPLLRWIADTGLAMVGMVGLLCAPAVVFGWNHHLHLGSPPEQGGGLAVAVLAGSLLAALTWLAFALHYTTLARTGTVLLAVAGVAVVTWAALPRPDSTAVVAGLALVTLLGFCPAIYLSAPTPSRRDTRDQSLPKLRWPVAVPLYLLAYTLAFTGLNLSLNIHHSVFVGAGDPRSVIAYTITILGFAVVGTLRSRAPSAYAALAASVAATLSLPLALGGLLLPKPDYLPETGPVLQLVLLAVLIPTLLWLAHHRATTAPLPSVPVAIGEGSV